MKKINVLFLFLLNISLGYSTVWQVGATHAYIKPSQVSSLVQNGDTVDIDSGTYSADVAHWTANNLLLRGVGAGYAHLDANNTAYGQKGIWVIGGNNTVVKNIEFSHCHDAAGIDKNWAGIRQEGKNLTVTHCYFHDNDDGILAGTVNPSTIIIEFTEFNHNGFGDGYSHNLYINHVDSLIFRYNYSHHATIGHELKSRAHVNLIMYNRFSNESTGDASREIDLPDGGTAIVMGNVVEQGPNSTNSGIIGYGLESLSNPAPHEFYMVNNTVVNDKSNGTFVSIPAGTTLFKAYNNIFAGAGTKLSGSATTIDTSGNWVVSSITSVGFVNPTLYDYHLLPTSGAVDKAKNAGTGGGFNLTPQLEYSHPTNYSGKAILGTMDIGAYEFNTVIGITEPVPGFDFSFRIADDAMTITCNSERIASARLVDLQGKYLTEARAFRTKTELGLSSLEPGIYIVEVICGSQRKTGIFYLQ